MTRTTLAAALVAFGLAQPAAALDLTAMTDAERDAFRDEVRSYLLDNPEVLMEAIQVLEARNAQAQVDNDAALVTTNAEDIYQDGYSWVGGNPEGDITLVEFIDYRCTYCRKAHDEVAALIETDGNIRFVVKEFPILGEQSVISSRFAIATLQQAGPDAYKQVHDALITFRGNLDAQNLRRLADSFDLDADAILAQMEAPEVNRVIDENRALAQRLQINGTPTFVLGEQMVRGYAPLQAMQQIVEEVRAQ
ncbi:protein-disulfide isomerase [Rhodovulum iodosum]|uniref:Protein-disulfide isomerase n=1 Tax=Rhodovulum iodosum TaxID=68291 RepID=A0ABV3XXT3_9RHOB|nr:DsbA family protein [Rhodovulum robiginosum]RSK38161.1 DsbA family protein [Rhodovulum robiginosum]